MDAPTIVVIVRAVLLFGGCGYATILSHIPPKEKPTNQTKRRASGSGADHLPEPDYTETETRSRQR